MLSCGVYVLKCLQGNLSTLTMWLLGAVLPTQCLWTSLRDVEGLFFNATIRALEELYLANNSDDNNGAEP